MSTIPVIGAQAPAINLPTSTGKSISLNDYAGKKTIVLFFYPKADTPGCTTEACGFRDATTDYTKANAVVLGISPDPVEDVTKFAQKFHFDFPLLADADHARPGLRQRPDEMTLTGREGRLDEDDVHAWHASPPVPW